MYKSTNKVNKNQNIKHINEILTKIIIARKGRKTVMMQNSQNL